MKLTAGRMLAISAVVVVGLVAILAWMSSRSQWQQGEPLNPGVSGEIQLAPSAQTMSTDMPMGVIDDQVVNLAGLKLQAEDLLVSSATETAFLQTMEIRANATVSITEPNKLFGFEVLPDTTGAIKTTATIVMGVDLASTTKVDVAQEGNVMVVTYTLASATYKDASIDPAATQIVVYGDGVVSNIFNLSELSANALKQAQIVSVEKMRAYACDRSNGVLDAANIKAQETMQGILKNTQVFKNYKVIVQSSTPQCQDES